MIMIGVSTGQNITNLIPAVQKSLYVDKFVLLETTTAKKAKWSEGIKKVLKNRNFEVEIIDLEGIDSHISKIQTKLTDLFKDYKQPLIWNLGGGQKPQQIPIWEVFKIRNEKLNIPDIVCYANQDDTGILEIWEYQNSSLTTRSEKISVDLSAEEIFNVFGFVLKEQPKLIYQKINTIYFEPVKDLLMFQDFREFLFKLPVQSFDIGNQNLSLQTIRNILNKEKQSITSNLAKVCIELISTLNQEKNGIENYLKNQAFKEAKTNQVLNKVDFTKLFLELIKQNLPYEVIELQNEVLKKELEKTDIAITPNFLQEITNDRYNKTSFYFEQIVAQRVVKLLQTTQHNIIEAYANLKTEKNGQQVAEYDVLCVTEKGTILALDAKTFEFENKDIDARLYNLEQGSGFYRNFSAVFPFDCNDLDKSWLKPVHRLPFDLNKKKFNFFVINDSNNTNFWIKQEKGKVLKSAKKPTENGWIECKTLDNFVKQK